MVTILVENKQDVFTSKTDGSSFEHDEFFHPALPTELLDEGKAEIRNLHPALMDVLVDALQKSPVYKDRFVELKKSPPLARHDIVADPSMLGPNPYQWEYVNWQHCMRYVLKTFQCISAKEVPQEKRTDFLKAFSENDNLKVVLQELSVHQAFRPVFPFGDQEWLSNIEIEAAVKYLTFRWPHFVLPTAHATDIKSVYKNNPPLVYMYYQFNLVSKSREPHERTDAVVSKAHRHLVVINTTEFRKESWDGLHWVALYVDTLTRYAAYFDSFGNRPSIPIMSTISIHVDYFKKIHELEKRDEPFTVTPSDPLIIAYSSKRLQKKGFNCGDWCILFAENMIRGYTLEEFVDGRGFPQQLIAENDAPAQKMRNSVFFRLQALDKRSVKLPEKFTTKVIAPTIELTAKDATTAKYGVTIKDCTPNDSDCD